MDNIEHLNMTHEEYTALTPQERIELNKQLRWNSWHNYHEMYPELPAPTIPCVIDGTLIIG